MVALTTDAAVRCALAAALAYASPAELSSGTARYQSRLTSYRYCTQVEVSDLCASATCFESDQDVLVAFRGYSLEPKPDSAPCLMPSPARTVVPSPGASPPIGCTAVRRCAAHLLQWRGPPGS